jgi:hypothetical protein
MSHTGFVELSLLQTDGQPAVAPNTRISVFDLVTGRRFGSYQVSFPPARRFEVPAYPESQVLVFDLTPERYMPRNSKGITVTNGETVARRLTVLRIPNKWQAAFAAYALLPVQFDTFKRILSQSPRVRMLGGGLLGELTGAVYDQISDPKQVLAKASLLNLYLKMRKTADPTGTEPSWFDYVEEILEINRERFVARAKAPLLTTVKQIRDNIGQYETYNKAPAGDHFKNYPKGYTVTKSKRVSIKTDDDKGNLQITAAPATDAQGNGVVLVDADIDENGGLLEHLVDIFQHQFTGGTHPHVIYDYLKLVYDNEPIGYELV